MRTSRDKRECVGIFGEMLRKRERCVMVDCILWHMLFQCFHLTIGVRERKKWGKIKNEKQERGYGKLQNSGFLQFSE